MDKHKDMIAEDDFFSNIAEDEVIESCLPEEEDDKSLTTQIVHYLPTQKLPDVNKRALLIESRTYRLEDFEQNAMIIFNQEDINGYDKRTDTDLDAKQLEETFQRFRFEVQVFKDLYRTEISNEMYKFSQRDFTDYGCIAIAILTHGSEKGGLRAKDRKYPEKKILEFIRKNPTVTTKPIVYIIQACRGTREAEVNLVYAKKDDSKNINLYKLPINADTLVLHSTYEGESSNRYLNYGSWLIQKLCEKINELADVEDLESIMTETKKEIAIHKELLEINDYTKEIEFNKQMPVTESTLIRKLYFKRKLMGIIQEPKYISNINENIVKDTINQNTQLQKDNDNELVESDNCEFCIKTALERFDYILKSLEYYIKDNPKDGKAKGLLLIAGNKEGVADDEIKIEVAKLIRNFFIENTSGNDKFKYLYIWNDFDES